MVDFSYSEVRGSAVVIAGQAVVLNGHSLGWQEQLDCDELGLVSGQQIAQAARFYYDFSGGACRPQLAALLFEITQDIRAMDYYFPLVNGLKPDEAARMDFYNGMRYIAHHPGLDLRIYGEGRHDLTAQAPLAVRFLVAGHLTEVFFYRRDIMEAFLSTPRHFQVYINRVAFEQDGGLAGGDYNFEREAVQLEMNRLFEGFFGPTPGVAPFLHELGHMLDHFDGGTGRMGQCEGILPGMSPRDGQLFTPHARQLFVEGKSLEQQRYIRYQDGQAGPNDPVPVGHPYVFQTDGEFIAGFLEMFFRNPNYFASQNPALYNAFAELLRQDPRRDWPTDFAGYVGENRKAFQGGQRPSPQHITIPYPV